MMLMKWVLFLNKNIYSRIFKKYYTQELDFVTQNVCSVNNIRDNLIIAVDNLVWNKLKLFIAYIYLIIFETQNATYITLSNFSGHNSNSWNFFKKQYNQKHF